MDDGHNMACLLFYRQAYEFEFQMVDRMMGDVDVELQQNHLEEDIQAFHSSENIKS